MGRSVFFLIASKCVFVTNRSDGVAVEFTNTHMASKVTSEAEIKSFHLQMDAEPYSQKDNVTLLCTMVAS